MPTGERVLLAQVPAAQAPGGEEAKGEEGSDFHSLYYSAHLPMDRQLSQDLEQAERLIADARFSEGLPLVDAVLAAPEDSFDARTVRDPGATIVSLKSQARRLLATLPPDGLAALELATGVTARRRLEEALRSGDFASIAEVAARYPATKAAAQATAILAQAHQEAGEFGTAARLYEELAASSATEKSSQLLLCLKGAICWSKAGHATALEATLNTLEQVSDAADKARLRELVGGDFATWAADLRAQVAEPALPSPQVAGWQNEGGAPTRNPRVDCGVPHAWSVWQARTLFNVASVDRLEGRSHSLHQEGRSWLLASSPLAVGDLVIVRTPRNVVAFDWATGRRVWETRPTAELDPELTMTISELVRDRPRTLSLDPLEQRVWIDSIYASLSADGRRAYAINDLLPPTNDNSNWRGQFFWGIEEEQAEAIGNTLCAYELESEGKLVWQINGGAAKGELAGVFFLGTPLAVGEHLYVMAEIRNAIHLLCLKPTTGDLEWKQPLVNMERSVANDVGRRLAGATPSYAEGLVICPTGAASIVAVDIVDRSLKWVYRCPVDKGITQQEPRGWQNQGIAAYRAKMSHRWWRARCTINDGKVVVTTPESEHLYCLDLSTGERLWQAPRENRLFVMGVAQDKVIVASSEKIEALGFDTGQPAWSFGLGELSPTAVVTGLGMIDHQHVLVPLSLGRMATIDISNGKLTELVSLRPGTSLGNLAFHRGSLLSQDLGAISRFDQRELLQQRSKEILAQSPDDPEALRVHGELLWTDGQLAEAIGALRQAYVADPTDPTIRHRLSEVLFEGLRQDYALYSDQTDLLAELVSDTLQRVDLVRLQVDGAIATRNLAEAWRQLLRLYQVDREYPLGLDRDHLTVADRWFAARVDRLWGLADAPLRATMSEDVNRLYDLHKEGAEIAPLAQLVRYFGGVPAGIRPRLHLAEQYLKQQRLAEAEIVLQRVNPAYRESDNPYWVQERWLTAQLCGRLKEIPRDAPSPADTCYPAWSLSDWSDGRVNVARQRVRSRGDSQNQMQPGGPLRAALTPAATGISWNGPEGLTLIDSGSQLLATDPAGQVVNRVSVGIPLVDSRANRPHELRCFRFGHFAVVGAGNRVASLDLRNNTRNGPGPLLWSSEGDFESDYNYEIATLRAFQRRSGFQPDFDNSGSSSNSRSGSLCAAGPLAVVVRDGNTLRGFDPLDGQLLWQRDGMPTSGPTFGDYNLLFLAPTGTAGGVIVSTIDGSTVGTWRRPTAKWITTAGRQIATLRKVKQNQHIEVVDPLTGDILLERVYDRKAAVTEVSPGWVAVMDPAGKIELVDVLGARVQFEGELQPEPKLESLHVVRDGNTLYWGANTLAPSKHTTEGYMAIAGAPLITGRIYSLDGQTGKPNWSRPATVAGLGIAPMQTPAAPVLLLLSHFRKGPNATATENTRILGLDKRNGRSLVREEGMAALETQGYWIQADRATRSRVTIDLERTLITLDFTDAPRPPEPVAQSEIEVAPERQEGSLLRLLGNFLADPPREADDD